MRDTLSDTDGGWPFPGLAIGHWTSPQRPTGCSVLLCPQGATAGVAVRGGSPGTRETDLLAPGRQVQQVHAVLLTGGSAFGLDAAGGVMRWLEDHGHGLSVGPARVPLVPAAVLFDLMLGDARLRPDAAAGHAACNAARPAPPAQGNVGAGAGATVGKLFGLGQGMKGGIGWSCTRVGGIHVAALVAVNALGDVLDEQGAVMAGARDADGRSRRGQMQRLRAGELPARLQAASATTIGCVITDAALDKTQAHELASLSHHGLSRAVDPITRHDGDTLFALATGSAGRSADLTMLGAIAADQVAAAIRSAVRHARSLSLPGLSLPAWCDLEDPA
ncbi:MAG: P1 family peptidase [Aquabacterium sp.]